jgi:structural maintenance of chromosome 4
LAPPELTQDDLAAVDKEMVQGEIRALDKRLEQMTPNMAAIEEYKRKEALHNQRLQELDEVTGERDAARRDYEMMRKERLDKFMAGFSVITNKLKEMYQVGILVVRVSGNSYSLHRNVTCRPNAKL